MSVNGAVWGRVRSRLRAFPEHLAACGAEASAYGKCVQASTAPGGRLSKDLCVREFEALRSCFAAAVLSYLQSCEDGQGKTLETVVNVPDKTGQEDHDERLLGRAVGIGTCTDSTHGDLWFLMFGGSSHLEPWAGQGCLPAVCMRICI